MERAKEAMVDVAQYINEVKRDSEVLVLLNNIQVFYITTNSQFSKCANDQIIIDI